MISLDKADRSRQNSVWVNGEDYLIHTEFYHWLAFGKKLERIHEGEKIFISEFNYLYKVINSKDGIEYGVPEDQQKGYDELLKFYINEQPLPKSVGITSKVKTLDWDIDSERICEVFLRLYGIDLETQDIHWHRFQGLFNSYSYNLDKVVEARLYEKCNLKTTKQIQDYEDKIKKESREMWSLEFMEKKEPFKMR